MPLYSECRVHFRWVNNRGRSQDKPRFHIAPRDGAIEAGERKKRRNELYVLMAEYWSKLECLPGK